MFAPRETAVLFRSLNANGRLIWGLVRAELKESVAGSAFGVVWIYLYPLLTMAIYIVIFAVIFRARLPEGFVAPYSYPAYILAGLIPWLMSQEIMSKSCSVLMANAGVVKEIVFPIEVLPIKIVLATLVNYTVPYAMYFGYVYLIERVFIWSHFLLPLVIGLQLLFLFGIALAFSAITPFFRDWIRIVGIINMLLIYIAPIVYLESWVPAVLRPFMYVNPYTYMTFCFHDVLFFGSMMHPWSWLIFGSLSILSFIAGATLFRKLQPLLGNVL